MGKMMCQKDLLFISELRKNCRESLTNISKKTQIPVSTLFDKIKNNELFLKHTTLVDFFKLGYTCKTNIMLKVKREDRALLQDFLSKNFNVNSLYKVNNDFDYFVEAIFHNIKEMQEFIENLESRFDLKDSRVYHIIEEIKREAFLSDPQMVMIIQPEVLIC